MNAFIVIVFAINSGAAKSMLTISLTTGLGRP